MKNLNKLDIGYVHPSVLLLLLLGIIISVTGWLLFSNKIELNDIVNKLNKKSSVAGTATTTNYACNPNLIVGASDRFTTIQAALNFLKTNPQTSNVICVRNNKIYGKTRITFSGTAANPIVLRSHPDNTTLPKIAITTAYPDWTKRIIGEHALSINKSNYVTVDGIEIERATETGVSVSYSTNIRLYNIIAHDTYGDGIAILNSRDVILEGCDLYRNEMIGAVTNCLQQPNNVCKIGEVLKVKFSDGVRVENCKIREDMSPKRGGVLNMGDSKNVIIKNNELYKNDGNHLHMGGAENVLVENNYVFGVCGFEGNGLYRMAERQPADARAYNYPGKNITFRNNLIVGMKRGFYFGACEDRKSGSQTFPWTDSDYCQFENVLIEKNTVVGIGNQPSNDESSEYAIYFSDMRQDAVKNVTIRNNVFHSVDDGNGDSFDYDSKAMGYFNVYENIWHDIPSPNSSNLEIPNLTGVFTHNPNLNACTTVRQNPELFRIAPNYSTRGADVSKVGVKNFIYDGDDIRR